MDWGRLLVAAIEHSLTFLAGVAVGYWIKGRR